MVETCASGNLLADLLAPGRSFSRSRSLVSTQMKVNSQARREVSFVANSATTETTKSNSSGSDSPPPRLGQWWSSGNLWHIHSEISRTSTSLHLLWYSAKRSFQNYQQGRSIGVCGGPRAEWLSSAGLRGVHWQFIWEEISDEFKRPRPCLPDGPCCVSWGEENLPT